MDKSTIKIEVNVFIVVCFWVLGLVNLALFWFLKEDFFLETHWQTNQNWAWLPSTINSLLAVRSLVPKAILLIHQLLHQQKYWPLDKFIKAKGTIGVGATVGCWRVGGVPCDGRQRRCCACANREPCPNSYLPRIRIDFISDAATTSGG